MPIEGEREKENFIAPAFPFWYFNFCSISCIFIPNVVLQNIRPPPQNLNLRTLNTHTSRNGNRMQLQHPNKCLCFNFLFHAITFYFSMSWKTSSNWWCNVVFCPPHPPHISLFLFRPPFYSDACILWQECSIQLYSKFEYYLHCYRSSQFVIVTSLSWRRHQIALIFNALYLLLECFLICFQRCIVCLSFHSIRQRFLCRTSNW